MWTKKESGRIDKLIFLKNLFLTLTGNLFRTTNIYVLTNALILLYFERCEIHLGRVAMVIVLERHPHYCPALVLTIFDPHGFMVLQVFIIHSFIPSKFTGPQLCTRHCLRCWGWFGECLSSSCPQAYSTMVVQEWGLKLVL